MIAKVFLTASAKGGVVVATAVAFRVIIGFVTQVVLARMLAPEIFGELAFVATVAMFFNAFTDLKGDVYVIHQKHSPERAINVVFTMELVVAVIFVLLVFYLAPRIMTILGKSELTSYVQLLSLAFFYNPLCRTRCLFERNLQFFYSKFPSVISQFLAASSTIALAYYDYGIWSLLWWRVSSLFGEIIILWMIAPYRPRLQWDSTIAKDMFGLTWPLTASAILSFFCYNIDYFIVGQFLEDGTTQLGYYWLGFQAAVYFLTVRQVLFQVLFPIFSRLDNNELKKHAFLRFSKAVAGLFLVLTIIAITFGRDLIIIFYGSNWEPAVFPFQVIFIVIMMRAISANIGYYLYSSGKTRPEFISVLISSVLLGPIVYFCTIHYGINGASVAVLIVQVIVSSIIYEWFIRPMTGCGVLHFFFWPWLISGMAFILVYIINIYHYPLVVKLILFVGLITLTYYFILRDVLSDLMLALKIMKNKGTEGTVV